MEKRKLGASSLTVSLVGLGTNNFGGRLDLEAARKVVNKALDVGVTHIDTADIYGGNGASETIIGQILGARRKEAMLATKFGKAMQGNPEQSRGSKRYVHSAVDASLKRLRTEWIDLLWMHEPDPSTPMAETFGALDELTKAGKIRHIAASNFSAEQITEAQAVAKKLGLTGFIASQDEYSLTVRKHEKDLFPAIRKLHLGLVPYFPLGGGALTGKYRKGKPLPAGARHASANPGNRFLDPHWDRIEALHEFAAMRGHTLLELAFSWLACQPFVSSIIAGAMTPEQVEANAKAVGWKLTPAEMAEVDKLSA